MKITKKIISLILIFSLLLMGISFSSKTYAAEETILGMTKKEYNEEMIRTLGLKGNPTQMDYAGVYDIIFTAFGFNLYNQKDWISINGKSDLISITLFYEAAVNDAVEGLGTKTYNVTYSEVDGYIREFTIEGLELEVPGVMPTDTEFGIPFCTREVWNQEVSAVIPESPEEVSGENIYEMLIIFDEVNKILTENNPTWGLKINGQSSTEDIEQQLQNIAIDGTYKVEYVMDNGYIRGFNYECISTPQPSFSSPPSTIMPTDPNLETTGPEVIENIQDEAEEFTKAFIESFTKGFEESFNRAMSEHNIEPEANAPETKKEYPNAGLENQTIIYILLGIAVASVIAIIIIKRKK